jgi:integrase
MCFERTRWHLFHGLLLLSMAVLLCDQDRDSRKIDLPDEITNEKFTGKRGTQLYSGMVNCSRPIEFGILLKPGRRFGLHNFGHSLATFLINAGNDVKIIQGLLRHAKASTTLELYSQAAEGLS